MPWKYQRGKRYWRQFHPAPFLFQEQFAQVNSAPFPDPFIAQPGPGSWRVVDSDLRMTTNGHHLGYGAAPGSPQWDRAMLQGTIPFARTSGRFVEFEITPTNVAYHKVGFNNAASASQAFNEAQIYVGGGGFINVTDGLDAASPLFPYTAGTSYTFRIYDTGTGFLYYVCPTASLPAGWVLLWERSSSSTHLTTLYLALNNLSLTGTQDFVRVRDGLIKPPVAFAALPPLNDAIDTGASDGLYEGAIKAPVNDQRSLYFRMVDANNYWRVVMDTAASTFSLRKMAAGVETVVGSQSFAWHSGAFYLIRVFCWQSYVRSFIGLTSGPIITDAFNQTATLFGTGPPGGTSPGSTGDIINLKAQTGGALLLN